MLRSRQPVVYAELAPATLRRLVGVPLSDVDAGGLAADAVRPWVDALYEELAGPDGDRVHVMGVRLLERLVGTDRAAGPDDAFRTVTECTSWASASSSGWSVPIAPPDPTTPSGRWAGSAPVAGRCRCRPRPARRA
ncbi:hypothetical protein [Nocardia farcinica]|uniref:hypothetical protein n=1 Tax=Nocardia farcinica TaxID=37329 RepID=UPI001895A54F|nr:hypothetical protein [Nocardia farcinica]MBF6573201.1 hypothetical protein [Nocardia farcinica]